MTGAVAASTLPSSRSRAAINPWVVAAVVVVPTFMEVLDTTIAVVALRYIAGGLSATVDDGEWVITSYLAANAIILPITGWLIAHLGRRNYFLLSIAVFTLALGAVRHGHEARAADPVPRAPGSRRRWSSAVEPGRAAGRLPGRAARHGHDAVRPGRADRARRRSDARRLDNRRLLLAVGVLDQRPRRPPGPGCVCHHAPGSRLPHGTAHGVAEAAVQLRRRSACRCWSSSWSVGR